MIEAPASIKFRVETLHPLASDSNDTLHPWGAARDSTTCPDFLKAALRIFRDGRSASPLWYLDLGCAGGGLVGEFLDAGHIAAGIDGSDWPKLHREYWAKYPDNFLNADISRPLRIEEESGVLTRFHLISAWEVLEHIPAHRLDIVFANVRNHILYPDGLFVGSISTRPDVVDGVAYHQTVKPREWWRDAFITCGFEMIDSPFAEHEQARRDPESFHFCARAWK